MRIILAIATAAALSLAAAAPGQVMIDMPPAPPAPVSGAAEAAPDLGDVALHRYSQSRVWPRDTYSSPGAWWWWSRPVGYFPPGYAGPWPYDRSCWWGSPWWGYPGWGWGWYGYGWPYRGWNCGSPGWRGW